MKQVYFFGEGKADGQASLKDLLGGKGANLAEMTRLGIPVPPGFTISTQVCLEYFKNDGHFPAGLKEEVLENLQKMEKILGAKFGSVSSPLLVSVRSGARVSMPGMMDTVLNLGLNDETVTGLAKISEDARFAYDSYRRLVQMYGDVVMGVPGELFGDRLEDEKKRLGLELDTELSVEVLRNLTATFKRIIRQETKQDFPDDPHAQLWGAIAAVFQSWHSKRAIEYRRIEKISQEWGTAVNVQAMVFGNMGDHCATGVAFTRNPSTGEKVFFGEYLINAQGEDVVAGIRTPSPINHNSHCGEEKMETLEERMPAAYRELVKLYQKLELHYRDMQDIEFTVQKDKLWLLQTRNGKRTAKAAFKIACDLVAEGLITQDEAILRIKPNQVDNLLHPQFDAKSKKQVPLLGKGLPASPGAATGEVCFSADEVTEKAQEGRPTILVRLETSPEDIHGMNLAEGILTARGGMTSHAAVVARGMGRPCVVGCGNVDIDYMNQKAHFKTPSGIVSVVAGDTVSLDGSTGEVLFGTVAKIQPEMTEDFEKIMTWCDQKRTLKVRANADKPEDARVARKFGAQGIGLCRTEHMFFGEDRIVLIRQMILADSERERRLALEKIKPLQRNDFLAIFREMKDLPVTIRLLDPPLHEFLPHGEVEIANLARILKLSQKKIRHKIVEVTEVNPMLGHRGCRIGLTFPEIYETQVRAIMEAAVQLNKTEGYSIVPEIMIPLISSREELAMLRQRIEAVCQEILKAAGVEIQYLIGTMIEIPRAAITADQIAEEADFFSFGTNDLTQMTLGLSRDDSNHFLPQYLHLGLMKEDPFNTLDMDGVGELMRLAVEKGRKTKKNLRCAICGEHGGDPSSVEFCHRMGLDYVSCSPFRVPIARLAAAQAALSKK